jgi:diguanylate cyclase (GGDEF)-like protein
MPVRPLVTIRIKMALIVTAFFIAVAALILSLQFFKLSGEIKDEISDHLFNRVSEEAANLDELIAARKNVIADAGKALPTGIADKPAELQKYIEGRKVLLGLFDSVYVASTKGDIVAYAPANPRALGTNLLNRAYFQQVLATRKPQISQPFAGILSGVPIVAIAAPVLDQQGEVVLVMGGVLQLLKPNILGKITEEKAGKTGYFFLFTKDGLMIEHPQKDLVLTSVTPNTDPVSVKALNGFEGTEEGVNANGLHALFSFKGLTTTNWVLGAALPVEEAFELVFRTEREMAWILAGATLLLGPLVWFVMLRLTSPLAVLHKTIRAIRQNPETLEQVPVSSNDEIGELAESFNQMVLELKERQTQRWVAEEKLKYLAYYDPLTGLPNRALCHDRLEQAIAQAHRHNHRVAVGCLDLDQLKIVNDSLGHSAGDEMLKTVADRLKACMRKSDTVARLAGDEFVLIFSDLPNPEISVKTAEQVTDVIPHDPQILGTVQRILENISTPMKLAGRDLTVTCSVGLSFWPQDGPDVETLLQNADAAMYRAKELGRNNFQFYMEEMKSGASERLSLQTMLRRALEREEFILYYQPKIDLKNGRLSGIEALIRWNSSEMGLVQPFKFIPILEETGMIIDVGKWVMERAVSEHARCLAEHPDFPRIAVNISQIQLRDEKFVETVKKAVEKSANVGAGLDFEITESLIMKDIEATISKLRAIREMGIGIAIDDYGTGYSSLNYLAKLPIDALKVDRTFIMNIGNKSEDMTIVSSIILLAHSFGLKVIAEGVETLEQLKLLTLLKCEEAQGYLISRPIPMDELLEWKARFSFEAIKTDQRGSGATT